MNFFRQILKLPNRPTRRRPKVLNLGGLKRFVKPAAFVAGGILLALLIASRFRVEPTLVQTPEVETVLDRGMLYVAVLDDVPGLSYSADGEIPQGLEAALAKKLARYILSYSENASSKMLEDASNLVQTSAMTVYARLMDGTADVAVAMLPRNASASLVYSRPYYTDTLRLVAKTGAVSDDFTSVGYIQSARTDSFYVPTSAASEAWEAYMAAENAPNYTGVAFASYADMFFALESGSVSAVLLSDVMFNKYSSTYKLHKTDIIIGELDYAFAATSDNSALVGLADVMLKELEESGELQALLSKFLG